MKRTIAALAALVLVGSLGIASAGEQRRYRGERVDGREMAPPDATHELQSGHLPDGSNNMKLVGKVKLGGTKELTDVDVKGGYAYVGTDYELCTESGGSGNGVFVVDVRRPSNPKQVGFIPGAARVGEGVHAFNAKSRKFDGRLLVWSNETCDVEQHGGITVVDVSDPKNPVKLAEEVGDTDANDPEDPTPLEDPNDVHSVMGWSDNGKIYAIMTDNFESGGLDVDIMDLTDPSNPVLIAETGLPEWPNISQQIARGDNPMHHDMWVKKIDGHWFAMVSYWDAGWVLLNLDNPADPQVVDDHDYAATDPFFPQFDPEGNAHQGTWSGNNRFFVGTDEDFSPYRIQPFTIESGTNQGDTVTAGEFGFTPPIALNFTDKRINGPTVFVGTACPAVADDPSTPEDESNPGTAADIPDASTIQAGPGEEKIAVVLRGTCFFSEKIDEVQQRGYDAVIIANHHAGSEFGAYPDAILCGSQGHEFTPTIPAVCISHKGFHEIFEQTPAYEDPADAPAIGTQGADVSAVAAFDGWGYA
ncbi:MAG: hypothetical protein H0U53_01595, partial [Actinobacteria bacterium]|nr:hypothetical protein [Actinomycetota bacterium]